MAKEGRNRSEEGQDRRTFLQRAVATASIGTMLGSGSTRATKRSAGGGGGAGSTSEAEADEANTGEADDDRQETASDSPKLGANLNGRPRRLRNNLELLDESNTTWVRAFFDIREKLHDGIHPKNDPDVVALRRAAREKNCKLIVGLKWGFKVNWEWDDKEPMNVPEPGSERELELRRCATRYLRNIGAPVDIVVLGNEPMWETKREDIRVENPPIVRFTRNVKDHLVRHGDHGAPRYLLGAFNRLYDDDVRKNRFSAFCRGMFQMARDDDDVDGIDLHVHYDGHEEARKMLAIARNHVPDGILTVTEFSPVHRYNRHVRTQIGEWQSGRKFADEYGYPSNMTAVDYFERAKETPRPRSEMADFYEAMPWYRGDHLELNYRLFERFDVSVGTFGFVQGTGMRHTDWRRPNWTPFHVNFLYQNALIRGRGSHPGYIDDYRRMAGESTTLPHFAHD